MATREFKLAPTPHAISEVRYREIVEIKDGERTVIGVVPNGCAMDVLDLIRIGYDGGREDMKNEIRAEAQRQHRLNMT